MRPLEILLLATNLVGGIGFLLSNSTKNQWFSLVPLATVIIAVAHCYREGPRFQLLPVYLSSVLLILCQLLSWANVLQAPRIVGGIIVACAVAAGVWGTIFPVFRLPKPDGPYLVGTQTRYLVDTSRHGIFSDDPNEPRILPIQVWYPVDPGFKGKTAPYRDKRISGGWKSPNSYVSSNSFLDAPVSLSQPKYPIVIFMPSWRGQKDQSLVQVENLASHGYVVIGMDHPYSTGATVFPDGRIIRTKLLVDENYSTETAEAAFISAAEEQIRIRTQDAEFVLDELEKMNQADDRNLMASKLDLQRIGVLGYSIGGGVAAELSWRDRRIEAGIDMGGMLGGESAKQGTRKPFLFMMEDAQLPDRKELPGLEPVTRRGAEFTYLQYGLMNSSLQKYGGYWMEIAGSTHINFSDNPLSSPFKFMTGAGSIDEDRCFQIINRYTVAFFDSYLKKKESALLQSPPTDWPEVRWKIFQTMQVKAPEAQATR